ncbi:MAG: mandelate racemase/muconate lactonizing enzyme family protein [Vicinamibacterales bacterium]|jgi:2-dehydro-3-deoxyphosphogalactonate aldolase|nr:mandelate racemase/muconate lactonizing enzyme family protein [Vicinamibacterales bacterium]MDP7692466.1 mandelate racemase/muconate lactonizing enzyme family protein [Vicinamibacterales bacterium]HJN46102.1 mandelate racemase/muconate lactonizing enzyme family protein [Vicinamibacterales bacterium]|tara:strand:- start:1663 stop:2913 length:1251 start_codon:yes stop_codon:yes gene_type:complete
MSIDRRGFLQRSGMAAAGLGAGMAATPPAAAAMIQAAPTRKIKITGYRTMVLDNIEPFIGHRKWLFLQLETDVGIVGLGERVSGGVLELGSQVSLLHEMCDSVVVGKSPFDIERIWQDLYSNPHDYRHPGLSRTPAMSAIDMACWDIVGKATGQPIYNLLGGQFHERLRAYAYLDTAGVWENPALAGERAAELVERGMTVCKLDPFQPITGGPRDYSLKTINHVARIFRAMRDAVGDELEIGIGTHGQFSTSGAIRVASLLEEFNPYFFEEPVSPENVDEMARVAAMTTIPIATGERLVTKFEFAEVLGKQAAGIIQLDVGQCGGILESKKIASMSEAHYAMIAPHMYCGPIAASAAVQLDTCSPNFLVQEFNTNDLHSEIFVDPITIENGFITPPTGPGLGVELNEAVVRRQLSD